MIYTSFSQLSDSKGAIFSEGMKQFSYILAAVVIGIYLVVFAIDRCIQYKKRSKIGDFRQGMNHLASNDTSLFAMAMFVTFMVLFSVTGKSSVFKPRREA